MTNTRSRACPHLSSRIRTQNGTCAHSGKTQARTQTARPLIHAGYGVLSPPGTPDGREQTATAARGAVNGDGARVFPSGAVGLQAIPIRGLSMTGMRHIIPCHTKTMSQEGMPLPPSTLPGLLIAIGSGAPKILPQRRIPPSMLFSMLNCVTWLRHTKRPRRAVTRIFRHCWIFPWAASTIWTSSSNWESTVMKMCFC